MNDNDLPSGPSQFELHKLDLDLKKFQAELEHSSKKFKAELDHSAWRAAYEGANAAGRTTINALLLASGGAVVALLAFLGNLLSKDTSRDYLAQTRVSDIVRNVANVLQPFAISMLIAVVATGVIYLSMFFYSGAAREAGDERKVGRYDLSGTILNWIAIALGAASMAMLCYGAYIALSMLRGL